MRPQDPWPYGIVGFEAKAKRFASPEKEIRLRELDFVLKHLSDIAGHLAEVLRQNSSPWALEMTKRYAAVAAAQRGEPLPKAKD